MKLRILIGILITLLLTSLAVTSVLADEVEDTEKTQEMKQMETALANDGISSADWEKGKYECWHIARDVQVGLWNNKQFDSALVRLKYKRDGQERQHFVLETSWKVGDKPVYIEPGTGKLYKGIENLLEDYSGNVVEPRVVDRYSRIQIFIDIKPCHWSQQATLTVKLTDRAGAVSASGPAGQPVKQQPLTVKITKADGTVVTYSSANTKTDDKGEWTTTIEPCPFVEGVTDISKNLVKVEVEVATKPVPAKAKASCRCTMDRQQCILPLEPWSSLNPVGQHHEMTATLLDMYGEYISGATVTFTVTNGPHAGTTGIVFTYLNGQAIWCYVGMNTGTDTIVATYDPNVLPFEAGAPSWNEVIMPVTMSREVYKTWIEADAPEFPPLPWVYDMDEDDDIGISEVLTAISDYFSGVITISQVLEVISLYFSG